MAAVQVLHKLVCASFTQTGRPRLVPHKHCANLYLLL